MEFIRKLKEMGKLFLTPKDICMATGMGKKKCLALFHREDFPGFIYVKTFLVEIDSFLEYFKTRRVILTDEQKKIEFK